MVAIVFKISESKKSILVGVKKNAYQQGYDFGWASNPNPDVKLKEELTDFPKPVGKEPIKDENGEVKTYGDGSPVMKWVW